MFCLIGYLCGLARDVPNSEGVPEQGHTALFEIAVTAAAAVCGEALTVALGKMLSDPRISVPAIRHVLPVAAAYDVLLCPFVLFAAAAALRLAGTPRSQRDRAAWAMPAARSPAGATQGAIRQVSGGNSPRLRLSERGKGEGLTGGLHGPRGLASAKREPRLKLGHSGSLGAAFAASGSRRGTGLSGGTMAGALGGSAAKVKFATRRREGVLGGSLGGLGGAKGGLGGANRALNSNLARSRLNSSRFGRSRMGRSLLGGSVFSRSPSALRASAAPMRSASIGRSSFSFLGRSPFLSRSSALGRSSAFGRTPSLGRASALGRSFTSRRPGPLARLAGALRRSARHQPRLRPHQTAFRQPIRTRSPGRGWLRRSSPRLGSAGRGRATGRAPRLGTRTRLHMPRPKGSRGSGSKKRWRTGGYR